MKFEDYKTEAHLWITLMSGDYYPDIISHATELYTPVLILFGKVLKSSESSESLFLSICDTPNTWMRTQLLRVFRKYVSPETPVEMLKRKTKASEICKQFGDGFRPIHQVQLAFESRPIGDEVLCALLWEYKDRGKKGYDLTERFFIIVRNLFPNLEILGPERAGKDILMKNLFNDYPNPERPIDFAIRHQENILAIGLARYDSDRGGSQEDDRTGGYLNCANEFFNYANQANCSTKMVFINDGPGLLLGSMWDDYAKLENSWENKILVLTLRMINERLTQDWFMN